MHICEAKRILLTDHDTSKLKLDPSDAKLRELVHWEIMCMDFWQVRECPNRSYTMGQAKIKM